MFIPIQEEIIMKKEVLKYKNLQYALSVPNSFDEEKKYPMIIFLHGAGTRGYDEKPLLNNAYFELTDPEEYNAVTFAPQCYADSWFDIFEQLQDFINFAIDHKFVDKDRVYVIGASMGGYATWQIAMTMPEKFAAIVPICGGGMYWNAERIKNIKVWAFHGTEDIYVYPSESKNMIEAINKVGGDARLTVCEGVGHGSWLNAYSSKELFEWLFNQSLKKRDKAENKFDDEKIFG